MTHSRHYQKSRGGITVVLCLLLLFGLATALLFFHKAQNRGRIAVCSADTALPYHTAVLSYEALKAASEADICRKENGLPPEYTWCHLLALASAQENGKHIFSDAAVIRTLTKRLKNGEAPLSIVRNTGLYNQFLAFYTSALDGIVGAYTRVTRTRAATGTPVEEHADGYGICAFFPLPAGFSCYSISNCVITCTVGTPIIAIEGGTMTYQVKNNTDDSYLEVKTPDGKRTYRYYTVYPAEKTGATVYAGQVIGSVVGNAEAEDTMAEVQINWELNISTTLCNEEEVLSAILRLLEKNRSPVVRTGETEWKSVFFNEISMAEK